MSQLSSDEFAKPHLYFLGDFWWCKGGRVTGMGKTPELAWQSMLKKVEVIEKLGVSQYYVPGACNI